MNNAPDITRWRPWQRVERALDRFSNLRNLPPEQQAFWIGRRWELVVLLAAFGTVLPATVVAVTTWPTGVVAWAVAGLSLAVIVFFRRRIHHRALDLDALDRLPPANGWLSRGVAARRPRVIHAALGSGLLGGSMLGAILYDGSSPLAFISSALNGLLFVVSFLSQAHWLPGVPAKRSQDSVESQHAHA